MTPQTRILVVDDSVVARQLLTEAFSVEPDLEVVGVAANGEIALKRIPQLNPDVVILDVEMPVMDGLATLREICRLFPTVSVVMFSSLTERGAAVTVEALCLGAVDYATKPTASGSRDAAMLSVREQLIPKVRALRSGRNAPPVHATTPVSTRRPLARPGTSIRPVEVVVIGVSTGGPNALAELLPALPGSLPVPILIVQHMPPMFTNLLASRLDAKSQLRVHEGSPGTLLEPGHAWIAPGSFHMTVKRIGSGVHLATNQDPPENSCRPAADVLLRSAAHVFGANTLAVVLTGMGQDALRGCELVREAGGQIVVQDKASSVVWGMPGLVASAGLADAVLPLGDMAGEIVKRVSRGRTASASRTPGARVASGDGTSQ